MNSLYRDYESRLRKAREEMNTRLEDAYRERAQRRKKLIDERFLNLARTFPEWETMWQVFRRQETEVLKLEYKLLVEPTHSRLILAVEAQWGCFHPEAAVFDALSDKHSERKDFISTLREYREEEARQREFEYISLWLTADWLDRRERKIIDEASRVGGNTLCVSAWLQEVLEVRRTARLPFSG